MIASEWQERLTRCAAMQLWPSRVLVVDACESTQDEAAARFAEHQAELAVFALKQTKGRGRLGRVWEQQPAAPAEPLGIAVTFALSAKRHDAAWLPFRAALATLIACNEASDFGKPRILIKWPNDIVTHDGRKIAGILVEKPASVDSLLLGIGINVLHDETQLPANVGATSLSLLARMRVEPIDVAERLLMQLMRCLAMPVEDVESMFNKADALTGTMCTFSHDNQMHTGVVVEIAPTRHIKVLTESGAVTLPAAATTVLKR